MNRSNPTSRLGAVLLTMTLVGCSTSPDFEGTPLDRPDASAAPALDPARISEVDGSLAALNTTGVVVLKDGQVIYEYGDTAVVSYLASCRKSVMSMLYGPHVADGTIDLSWTLEELGIDDVEGLLPLEKQATVQDIISARSGVFHPPANGGYDEANVKPRGSMKPGEYYLYNNWDFNVAGTIFEQVTGQDVYEGMARQLAEPLGFQDWRRAAQKKKRNDGRSRHPAYHLYLSTRDMAKLGQLMLDRGRWNGEQLIPEAWIDWSLQPLTSFAEVSERNGELAPGDIRMAYGAMWWLHEDDPNKDYDAGAFSATGWGGQFITVYPEVGMVIAHKTKLSRLTLWGLTSGGVPHWAYWQWIDELMAARTG